MNKLVFILLAVMISTSAYSLTDDYSYMDGDWQALEPCQDNEYRTHGSICTPCSSTELGYVGSQPEECSKCKDSHGNPTRKLIDGSWCAILDCGEENFQDVSGNCWPCSDPKELRTTYTECSKCKDMRTINMYKNTQTGEMVDFGNCLLTDCGKDSFRAFGDCHSCSDSKVFKASADECLRCKDADGNPIRRIGKDLSCSLLTKCNVGEFRNTQGDCVSCSESLSIFATSSECEKCQDANGNKIRKMFKDACGLANCEDNTFRTLGGACISCETESHWMASEEECAKCKDENGKSTRKIFGYTCEKRDSEFFKQMKIVP